MRVEHVNNVKTEIFLKPFYIGIGAMKNLENGRKIFTIEEKKFVLLLEFFDS